jgi:hypothetical protein
MDGSNRLNGNDTTLLLIVEHTQILEIEPRLFYGDVELKILVK